MLGFLSLLIYMTGGLSAQQPIGTWQTYLPWGSATQVVQSPDRIYCASPYSVFYIEKSDGSINTLTKSNGLSDAGVSCIGYNTAMNTLVIAYTNSNIDLLVNGTDIYNIPDIKNAIITGSKNINSITMIGSYAYLATDLGISVLDLGQQQIMSNYIIGSTGISVKVNSIASDGVTLFAATAEGVKSAPLSSPDLQDYTVWTIYNASLGLPTGEAASLVGQLNGKFYAVVSDTLYVDSAAGFAKIRYDSTWSYQSLCNTGGDLYACQWGGSYFGRLLQIQPSGNIAVISPANSPRPLQVTIDGNTDWIADDWNGLVKYNNFTSPQESSPDGPPDLGGFRMVVSNHTLYMAAGGTVGGEYDDGIGDPSGPIIYNQVQWKSYPINSYGQISNCTDLVDVAVDAVNQKAYYASLAGGLVEVDYGPNFNIIKYDPTNTNGVLKYDYGTTTQIMSLALDPAGNLWMSNKEAPNVLVLKTVDGQWTSFHLNTSISPLRIRKMLVDANGYIWMGDRFGGMIVYNPGQNITDPSDDQIITMPGPGTGNGNLSNGSVWSIASDNEGNVWVGTNVGISTYYCAGSLFYTPGQVGCDATWIKVNQGGYIGYLFSTEIVQALAVDGADRKWVGTTNGVWLISADGTTQLLHFTSDNSPLPNNNILDMAIDQQSGEVWIGTDGGIVSYQGDAILGASTKGDALVYPNPVKSSYTGPIAIKGLVENAYVKITDASGILVYQGQANGGQMIWNGQGYSGNKVSTGIYTVYADAADGSQHNVGKIIFIK